MKQIKVFYTLATLLICCLFLQPQKVTASDFSTKMEGATVFILADSEDSYGFGSGFVVAEGLVVTNAHVVEGFDTFLIMNELIPPVQAKVIALESSGGKDFALMRFKSPSNVTVPILSFSTKFGRTDKVSAWGYPYMITKFDEDFEALLEGSSTTPPPVVYTEGTISTIIKNKTTNIIHTAPIAGGNSGGPLVNTLGEVVGINTWGSTEEDEGAFVNAALVSEDIILFLKSAGLTPLIVGQNNKIVNNTGKLQEISTSLPSAFISGVAREDSSSRGEVEFYGDKKWQNP